MAKLMRESRLRERKLAKKVRKDAREHAPLAGVDELELIPVDELEPAGIDESSAGDAGDAADDD